MGQKKQIETQEDIEHAINFLQHSLPEMAETESWKLVKRAAIRGNTYCKHLKQRGEEITKLQKVNNALRNALSDLSDLSDILRFKVPQIIERSEQAKRTAQEIENTRSRYFQYPNIQPAIEVLKNG